MITSYSINNTNQHQHKLRNSKIIARNMRAIYPKIPRTVEAPETPETPETLETLETVETVETADPASSVWENLSMRRRENGANSCLHQSSVVSFGESW